MPPEPGTDGPTLKPRVVLLTLPSLFGAQVINRLSAEAGLNLVGVGLSTRIDPRRNQLAGISTFWWKTGWRYFTYSAMVTDVAWTLLRLTGKPRGLKSKGLSVRSLKNVNSPDALSWLESLAPDYVVSYYFNQWIGKKVRTKAKLACLNVHPSPLPALRGPDPVFRALERKRTSTGITIHHVTDEIDSGPVLDQQTVEIPSGVSATRLYSLLMDRGADRVATLLANGLAGGFPPQSSGDGGDYTTFPTPAEVARFCCGRGALWSVSEWRQLLRGVE